MTKKKRRSGPVHYLLLAAIVGGMIWLILPRGPRGVNPARGLAAVTAELRGLLRAQDAYRAQRPDEGYASSLGDLVEAGFGEGADWADGEVSRYTITLVADQPGASGSVDEYDVSALRLDDPRSDSLFADESTLIRTGEVYFDGGRPLAVDQIRLLDLTDGGREIVAEVGVRVVRIDTETGDVLRRVTTAADRVIFGVDPDGNGFLWRLERGELALWPFDGSSQPRRLQPPDGVYYSAANRDGTLLLGRRAQSSASVVADAADPGSFRTLATPGLRMNSTTFGIVGRDLVFGTGFERTDLPDGSAYNGAAVLTMWDATTGEELRTLRGTFEMAAVTFSRGGSWVMTRSNAGSTVAVREVRTGALLHRLVQDPSGQPAQDVFFSPDGALIVTGGRNGLTRVWDAREGVERAVLPTGAGAAVWRDVALWPDARLIVASGSEELTVWDLSTGMRRHTLIDTHEEGHDRVHSFVISPDGAVVWAVIDDRVHSWSLETGEEQGRVDLPDDAIDPALVFDDSGRLLGVDRAIRSSEPSVVWDIERREVAFTLPASRLRLVDPDRPLAATGGDAGGPMVVHDLNTGTTRAAVTIPAAHLPVALSEDGRWIVSMGTRDARGVLITSIADSDTVLSMPDSRMEHAANHQTAAVSAAAGLIAFAEGPAQYPFTLWNARTGEPVREGELDSPYSARALSERGRVLMVNRMGEGSIVEARSGEEVVQLGRGRFLDALFDASGARLAAIGDGGDVTVWDAESGEVVGVVRLVGGGR